MMEGSEGRRAADSEGYRDVRQLERGKVKHQRVLRLTLLAAALLPISFLLFCLLPERIAGGIFQTANTVLRFIRIRIHLFHVKTHIQLVHTLAHLSTL